MKSYNLSIAETDGLSFGPFFLQPEEKIHWSFSRSTEELRSSRIKSRSMIQNAQAILFSMMLGLFSLGAGAQVSTNIAICDNCDSAIEFSQAAFLASDLFPGQYENVYVTNTLTEETKVYRVELIVLEPGGFGDTSIDVNIAEIDGDTAILNSIAEAYAIIKDLNNELIKDFDAGELDLSFDSALDLIGPSDSGAGGYRNELETSLTEHYRTWMRSQYFSLTDITDGILDKIAPDRIKKEYVRVKFEDGTEISVEFIKAAGELESSLITIKFKVDQEMIIAPGMNFVPKSAGQFANFVGSDLDYDLAQELRDLAFFFGIPVVGQDDSPNCESSWTCDVHSCTVTVSC